MCVAYLGGGTGIHPPEMISIYSCGLELIVLSPPRGHTPLFVTTRCFKPTFNRFWAMTLLAVVPVVTLALVSTWLLIVPSDDPVHFCLGMFLG